MMMATDNWTQKELDYIKNNYKSMSDADMSVTLKRKKTAVGYIRRKMGWKHHVPQPLTTRKSNLVARYIQNNPDATNAEITAKFDILPWAIYRVKTDMGLYDDEDDDEMRKDLTSEQRRKIRYAIIDRLNACPNKTSYKCKCDDCLEMRRISFIFESEVDEHEYYEEIKHLLEG